MMSKSLAAVCVLAVCAAAVSGAVIKAKKAVVPTSWDVDNCTFTSGNKTWDFSPLFATNGSYTWQQTMYTFDSSNTYDGAAATPVPMTFEVQICGNVQSKHAACTTPSPVNMIAADGSCAALGSWDVSAFDVNPYADGAYLTYYHGDGLNHIQHYEARVYFVCDPTHFNTPIYAEHMKTFYQWHFKFFTKYAC